MPQSASDVCPRCRQPLPFPGSPTCPRCVAAELAGDSAYAVPDSAGGANAKSVYVSTLMKEEPAAPMDTGSGATGPARPAPPPGAAAPPPSSQTPTMPIDASMRLGLRVLPSRSVSLALPAFAGYQVMQELGRGGMGIVYKAKQTALDRIVALKVIRADQYADESDLVRFRMEAEACARLTHPNIVQIHEIGEQDGRPFFSLEFLDGGTLADRIARRQPSPDEAAAITETLARAVHYAHQRNIVHRDLKPANILLTAEGVPKITDFGLAKHLVESGSGNHDVTASGVVIGTPAYMAPEQARGRAREAGPPADIYALGAILYHMLAGKPPFGGEGDAHTLMQVVSEEPVPPSVHKPDVPFDLQTICLKCLEKDPFRRYASADALAEDLRRFLGGETIRARAAGPGERLVKFAKRRPATAALAVVTAAAAAALTVVNALHNAQLQDANQSLLDAIRVAKDARAAAEEHERDADKARSEALKQKIEAERRRIEAEEQRAIAEGRRTDADRQRSLAERRTVELARTLYFAEMNLALQSCRAGRLAAAAALLEHWVPPAGGDDLRGFEWQYLRRFTSAERLRIKAHGTYAATAVCWSADGATLASGGTDHGVELWDAVTGMSAGTLHDHRGPLRAVAFQPKGRVLAAGDSSGLVQLWDTVERHRVQKFRPHSDELKFVTLAFSPDGRRLVTCAGVESDGGRHTVRGEAKLWDIPLDDDPKARRELAGLPDCPRAAAFSPDGELVAVGCADGTVSLYSARTRAFHKRRELKSGLRALAYAPGGKVLAAVVEAPSGQATVQFLTADLSDADLRPLAAGDGVYSISWSPDGRRLAAGGPEGRLRIWDVSSSRGTWLWAHAGGMRCVEFAPDGRSVATAGSDGTVCVWDAETAQDHRTLVAHDDRICGVAFTSDGKTVVTAGRDGAIKLADPAGGGEPAVLGRHRWPIHCLAVSVDGRMLAAGGGDERDKRPELKLWDLAGRTVLREVPGHLLPVGAVAFSPNGRILASGGWDGVVRLTEVESGRDLGEPLRGPSNQFHSLAFSPDGRLLAAGGGRKGEPGFLRIWEVATGRDRTAEFGIQPPLSNVVALAFSPDGATLASGEDTWDKPSPIRLWSVGGCRPPRLLPGHAGPVLGLAWSPDGKTLAGVGGGPGAVGEVKLWNPELLRERLSLEGHRRAAWACAFSPDGRMLATAGGDGAVLIWQAAGD